MARVIDILGQVQVSMKDYLWKVDANENTVSIRTTTVPKAVEVEIVQLPEDSSTKDSHADTHTQKDSDDSTVSDWWIYSSTSSHKGIIEMFLCSHDAGRKGSLKQKSMALSGSSLVLLLVMLFLSLSL